MMNKMRETRMKKRGIFRPYVYNTEVDDALKQWKFAQCYYDSLLDADKMEFAIYQLQAAKVKYMGLRRKKI